MTGMFCMLFFQKFIPFDFDTISCFPQRDTRESPKVFSGSVQLEGLPSVALYVARFLLYHIHSDLGDDITKSPPRSSVSQ